MRLAIVVGSFPVVSETFIVNQIADLIDRGHEILIFAFQQNKSEVIHQKILDYNLLEKTIYFQDIHISKSLRYLDFLKFLIANRGYVNIHKIIQLFDFRKHGKKAFNLRNYTNYKWILDYAPFDIIHAHFGTNATIIAEMKTVGYFANTGFVTSFHGYDISPNLMPQYPAIYKILFKEVDLITVNTKYSESLLHQLTSSHKLEILPVGLDTGKFKKRGIKKEGNFTILFVGRLIEFKGAHLTIEILNLLLQKGNANIFLKIVGAGELKNELEKIIENYNLQEKVELKGALTQEQIIELMDTADVFLLPGIYDKTGRAETQGLVIQEAQAMELPVIVSDVGGMKYGLIDGETGFVVKEKDIDAFVDKIEFLITNENERKEMGKRGRAYILENYDSKVLGSKLIKNYMNLMQK